MRLLIAAVAMACTTAIPEPDRRAPRPSTEGADTEAPADTDDGPPDADGDGYPADVDCDDDDASVNPGAEERCDPIDRNCDGRAFSPDDCPCPTIRAQNGVFLSGCAEPASWTRARDLCALYAMRLVVIPEPRVNAEVAAIGDQLRRGSLWIGLSDREVEGRFVWVDGAELRWSNWEPFEPNDLGRGEDCALLNPWSGRWNDADCDLSAPFVCEPDPAL
jgi:hypothetical protein